MNELTDRSPTTSPKVDVVLHAGSAIFFVADQFSLPREFF